MKGCTRIIIRPQVGLLIAMLLLFLDGDGCAAVLVCAFLHEAGHITALLALGGWADEIELGLFGAKIHAGGLCSVFPVILCLLAGPLLGALPSIIWLLDRGNAFLTQLCDIALATAVWNLVPYPELDGGVALLTAFQRAGDAKQNDLEKWLRRIVPATVFAAGMALHLRKHGSFFLLGGMTMMICSCQNDKKGVEYHGM